MGLNQADLVDISKVIFAFRTKISLPKELCGKAHCHEAKYKDSVFMMNVLSELESRMFG
jgi:hypothetical protein